MLPLNFFGISKCASSKEHVHFLTRQVFRRVVLTRYVVVVPSLFADHEIRIPCHCLIDPFHMVSSSGRTTVISFHFH